MKKKNNEKLDQRAQNARAKLSKKAPKYTQAECLEKLRKWVEKAPIPPIQKQTLTNISKVSYFRMPSIVEKKSKASMECDKLLITFLYFS